MPALYPVIEAALASGAKGAFLSGAGSSIMAFSDGAKGDIHAQHHAERKDSEISEAMVAAAKRHGVTGRVFITKPSFKGAHAVRLQDVVERPPPELMCNSYYSTRDLSLQRVSFEHAVMTGLAPDGGLFVARKEKKKERTKRKEFVHKC
jgi:hypothetical protein